MSDDGITRKDKINAYQEKADSTDGTADFKARAVCDMLTERLKKINEPIAIDEELGIASDVLCTVAENNEAVETVKDYVVRRSPGIASDTQISKEDIRAGLLPSLNDLQRQEAMAERDQASGDWTLDNGMGVDEYIEQHIESVVKSTTTDHVDDITTVFRFDTNVQIEFDDNEHLSFERFYPALANATEAHIREDFASVQALQYTGGDVTEDGTENKQNYREMSLGPEDRPWIAANWNECITDVVDEYCNWTPKHEQPVGPRTEAFEYIQNEIQSGQVTTDKADAVDMSAVYVAEDCDEIWVPNTIVDTACEDIAVNRETLVRELKERGVGSDEISGNRFSKPVTVSGMALRMWRFDATHPEIPEPADPTDSLSIGGFGNLPSSGAAKATDGGEPVTGDDDDNESIDDVTNDDGEIDDNTFGERDGEDIGESDVKDRFENRAGINPDVTDDDDDKSEGDVE